MRWIHYITSALQKMSVSIQSLIPSIPLLIITLLIIALVVILITLGLVHFSIKRAEKAAALPLVPSPPSAGKSPPPEEKETDKDKLPLYLGWVSEFLSRQGYVKVSDLSLYFLRGLEFLRKYIGATDYKYRVPWFMVVGGEKSGKTSFINSIRLEQPFGPIEFQNNHPNPPCQWTLFRRGLFLDIRGDLFLPNDSSRTDAKDWRSLLILLSRYRSARPLNGIILTISASELYGKSNLSKEAMGDRAQTISARLLHAQQSLGIRLPVYIVITKCDVIPGFQNFCSELPSTTRDNILGWSSPYALDVDFNAAWIDEGFFELNRSLTEAKFELLSKSQGDQTKDGIFVFPHELLKVKDNLVIYLSQVFKSDGYHESLLFRGFYFCGDSGMKSAQLFDDNEEEVFITLNPENVTHSINEDSLVSQLPRQNDTSVRKLYFVEDLVGEKILYEYGLANPLRRKIATINRGLNITKASAALFVLVGTYGLFSTHERFMQGRDRVIPMLSKINSILADVNQQKTYNSPQTSYTFDLYARELIDMMQQLQNTGFFSILVPSSWFSSLHNNLNHSLKIAYQQIIIRTIYVDLLLKARDLFHLKPQTEDQSYSIGQLVQPLTSQEFLLVKRYVEGLDKLQSMVRKFNVLKESGDSNDLDELVQYTFQTHLPKDFVENYDKFRKFLKDFDFPTIDLKPYTFLARETLNLLYQNFLNAIFTVTHQGSLPERLNHFFQALSKKDKGAIDLEYVRKFSLDLAEAKVNLGEAGKTWMDAQAYNPGRDFDALFDKIDRSTFFGKDVSQFLVDQTAIGFQNLKMQLQVLNQVLSSFPADINKSLTDNKGKAIPISSGVLTLEKILTDLFDQPYMAIPTNYPLMMNVPSGKMVLWDGKLIDFANDMVKKYEDYNTKNGTTLPPAIHENLMLIARQSLQANVLSIIGRAQNFISYTADQYNDGRSAEEILRTKTTEMKETYPKFVKLLEVLQHEDVGHTFMQLRDLLANHTMWLLTQVDKVLISYALYTVKDPNFSWWDGKPGATYKAYSVTDAQDLNLYLTLQRQHLGMIANDFARPLVQFLLSKVMTDAPGDKALVHKWRRIIEQMEGYQKKQANNSLILLEDFITVFLSTCDAHLCLKLLSPEKLENKSGDYFIEILRTLNKGLLKRSEVLQRQANIQHYNELIDFYNKNLKGNFPFVGRDANVNTPDVEPFLMKEFFQKYTAFGGSAKAILDQVYQLGESALPAYRFLESLDAVKNFFKGFLESSSSLPTFDVIIDFRVNRPESKGDDLVVDWIFKPSDTSTINNHDQKKQGTWTLGKPIQMAFRWPSSKSIPAEPRPDPEQPQLKIDGRTATLKYDGMWSLLRMLGKQKDETVTDKDPHSYVLRFEIPIGNGKTATLFNQIKLLGLSSNPKKPGEPVEVPDFPSTAPSLPQDILEKANQPVLTENHVTPYEPSEILQSKTFKKESPKQEKNPKEVKKKTNNTNSNP